MTYSLVRMGPLDILADLQKELILVYTTIKIYNS